MKELFRQRLLDFVSTLIRDLRVTPFEPSMIELELVANNDGAFFSRHIGTFTGDGRKASDRVLSAVYYFHTEPKAFAGGAPRFYSLGAEAGDSNFTDMQPDQARVRPISSRPARQVPSSPVALHLDKPTHETA
jgi:Rps23 Pro-64 3,4-dihydroxylase Tpa1-like proline 4-hydroxylase